MSATNKKTVLLVSVASGLTLRVVFAAVCCVLQSLFQSFLTAVLGASNQWACRSSRVASD